MPVVREQRTIWELRRRHKVLTRGISRRLTYGPHDLRSAEAELRQTDELIVHNIAIQFNRLLWYVFLPALLIIVSFLYLWQSSETPVFIKVRTTKVKWTVANSSKATEPTIPWHMYGNENEIFAVRQVLLADDTNETDLTLIPDGIRTPVEIAQLSVPDKCQMSLNFTDSVQSEIIYEWRDSLTAPPSIKLEIVAPNRKFFPSNVPTSQRLTLQKQLRLGDLNNITLVDPQNWRMPVPIRVTELRFETQDWDKETRSAIVSGEVKVLNVNDPAIMLNRGDWLDVKFKDTVDIYLSSERGLVTVQTSGIAHTLRCGPVALGNGMNRMPRVLKTLNDESPYLLTLAAIVIPLLMAMIIRQRKSI